jgi:hypothetical protein
LVETEEPSEFQKSILEEATYLRGRALTAYSQVEFLLADISVKLDLKFPYLIKDRIKAAKNIAERPGYELYKDDLAKVCDELLQFDEIRKFMAHGWLSATFDKKGNHELEYRMYERDGQGKFNLVMIQTTVPYLQNAADAITKFVTEAVTLFRRIYLEKQIEKGV